MSLARSGLRRWPLHPRPGPLESMSSWLGRLAKLYGLSTKDLLRHNLDLLDVPWDVDGDPSAAMLAALAERTGVGPARLRTMTLAGWRPWLFDTLYVRDWEEQTLFDTYVRDNSVLLAPGEAGRHQVGRFKRWAGPWLPVPNGWPRRVCPVCADDPDRGASLMWKLPLMVGCVDHGCWLEDVQDIEVPLALNGHPPAARPVAEPLATLDRYTHNALTTGRVELPGRSVHAGVWFRLLRSLLDEVSLATSTVSKQGRTTLEQVWEATGRPGRGGLTVWKPYEQLDRDTQETMLYAAAVALHLAADRRITTRGRLASVIQPPADLHVYDGDNPRRRPLSMSDLGPALDAWLAAARTDPEPARQTLRLLTAFDSSPTNVAKQRHFLISQMGIPPEFLRLDLLPTPGRTAAETVALLEREGFEPGAVRQAVGDYPAQVPARTDGPAGQSEYRFGNHDLGQLRIQLRAQLSR